MRKREIKITCKGAGSLPTKGKSNAGRKLFDGKNEEKVIQKLEWAFLRGATDEEACNYAGISKTAFYNYQEAHSEFLERKEILKSDLKFKARLCVYNTLRKGKDSDFALRVLERIAKGEFSTRSELTGANGKPLFEVTEDQARKMAINTLAAIEERKKARAALRKKNDDDAKD